MALNYDLELKEIYQAHHKTSQFLLDDPNLDAKKPTDATALAGSVDQKEQVP